MANGTKGKQNSKGNKSGKFPKLKPPGKNNPPGIIFWIITIVLFILLFRMNSSSMEGVGGVLRSMPYGEFYRSLEENPSTQKISKVVIMEEKIGGQLSDGTRFSVNIPPNDTDLIKIIQLIIVSHTQIPG